MDDITELKFCNKCETWKPLGEFHNDASQYDGHTKRCKECNNAASNAYAARQKAENPDGWKERRRIEVQKRGKPKKKYSYGDPDVLREYRREYAATHREQIRTYEMVRRARKLNAPVIEPINRLVVAKRDGWICGECSEPIDPDAPHKLPDGKLNMEYLHIDHIIPLSKGGSETYDNVQATHARCNLSKHDRLPGEKPPWAA